ncbi:MAG: peroxiredoxin, partial [Planctomycetota bacterium]
MSELTTMPTWSLPSSAGDVQTSAALAGTPYVLYFYPKDSTPGCTTEACDFRDNLARLSARGVRVFGVSPDGLAKHGKFIAKHELTFPLLVDAEHELMDQLDVWALKKFMGREFMGVV